MQKIGGGLRMSDATDDEGYAVVYVFRTTPGWEPSWGEHARNQYVSVTESGGFRWAFVEPGFGRAWPIPLEWSDAAVAWARRNPEGPRIRSSATVAA